MDQKVHDIQDILKVLPHRYPILLVDRVEEIFENGGKGYKNVTFNEPFFQGHFPGKPVMPGVLIVEGMAQCSGYIALKILEKQGKTDPEQEKIILFMMIDKCKFRRMVVPGDRLDYEIEILKLGQKVSKFKGTAKVNGEIAAEAELVAMMESR